MNSDDDRQDPSEWKDRIATQVSAQVSPAFVGIVQKLLHRKFISIS